MAKKEKRADKRTEAEMEPGFFSDYGYGNGTALTITYDSTKDKKKPNAANKAKSAKNKRK